MDLGGIKLTFDLKSQGSEWNFRLLSANFFKRILKASIFKSFINLLSIASQNSHPIC